jgi:hypothetical protein
VAVSLVVSLVLGLGACRKPPAGPPPPPRLELPPAEQARPSLTALTRIADPDGTLAKVGVAVRKLGLPFNTDDVRRTLIQKSGWPYALVNQLDLHQPVALALLSLPATPRGTVVAAMALKDRSPAGRTALLAAAGTTVESDKDAVQVAGSNPGHDKLWLLARDGVVVVAETKEALLAGSALALASRSAGPADVSVDLHPEAMARAAGTDLRTAMQKMKSDVVDMQARTRAQLTASKGKRAAPPATDKLVQESVGFVADLVGDTAEARLDIGVDPEKGLTTATVAQPRPGSGLARAVARRAPYQIDPALLSGDPPVGLWALGDNGLAPRLLAMVRAAFIEPLSGSRDRERILRSYDTIASAIAGPWSGAMRMAPGPKMDFSYDLVYRLKPGTDGGSLLSAMAELTRGPWLSQLLAASTGEAMAAKVTSKREGEVLTTVMTLEARDKEAKAKLAEVPFFNGKPVTSSVTVTGDRLVMAVGGASRQRLTALSAGGAPAGQTGDAAAALAETRGAEGLYYIDAAAALRPALSLAAARGDSPGMAGAVMGMALSLLGDTHLYTYVSYQGGDRVTFTWRMPMATFQSAARMFKVLTGAAGGSTTTQPL